MCNSRHFFFFISNFQKDRNIKRKINNGNNYDFAEKHLRTTEVIQK